MENDCEVSLPHTPGIFFGTMLCNNGEISGHGVSISETDHLYTSELIVLVNNRLQGRTITCSADFVQNVTLVDAVTVNVTTGSDIIDPCIVPLNNCD